MTRTDARAIVTHYTYDALDRLTGKSYTNDPANTPALAYGYDVEYPWQLTQDENNPVGHLNSIQATLGTTNLVTWTSGDYDQRGNLTGYVTCMGGNPQGCPGFGVGANLGYDLNEDLVAMTGDAGGPTYSGQENYIAYGYDTAGRLRSIATDVSLDLSGNSLTSTAFSGLTYFPGGQLETASLAIDPTTKVPAISLSRSFDNRGRPTGEVDLNGTGQSAYSYAVSYDGNGNVSSFNDSVAGAWTVKSDALHRLLSSTGTYQGKAGLFQETYDHFGNRNVEYFTYGGTENQPSAYLNFPAGNNRILNASYDNAGNLKSDGTNNYLYDAENRICATSTVAAGGRAIGYLYAPDGTRLGKGNITQSFSCDYTKNGMLTASGLALTTAYNMAPNGDLLEETDGNFNLNHFDVFLQGKLLGTYAGTTYSQSNWSFALNDWVGTKRQIIKAGSNPPSFFSGPFGDYQEQNGSGADPSDEHFTGKKRDAETGLDYFGARHYGSNMGRFMSPDWSDDPSPVPWADLENPQTLNLYSYVQNNPLSRTDAFGHDDDPCKGIPNCASVTAKPNDGPSLTSLSLAVGHHFVDQAITRSEGAWNSLAGQFFRRWTTGGPLKNPGVHTGYPKAARLNTQQIQTIVDKYKEVSGRDISQWTKQDIENVVQEVQTAGGDTGKFLADIAEENPTVRTVTADIQGVMGAAQSAYNSAQQAAGQIGPALEEGAESVEAACDGGPACIP